MTHIKLVHVESVERVIIDHFGQMEVKQLKNLKQLYVRYRWDLIDSTFLPSLEQLKEVHLNEREHATEMLEQRRRYGRTDLKVYLSGLLLNGLGDPEMNADFPIYNSRMFAHLAENPSRLADRIPFYWEFYYSTIESVAPEVAINVLNRLTDLDTVYVKEPVQDIERFLVFLKTFGNITTLHFQCAQPQELFDRLPEHCTVQCVTINPPADLQFLFRLKHLVYLYIYSSIEIESIRTVLEELEFVSVFRFSYKNKWARIEVDKRKRLLVSNLNHYQVNFSDPNAAIEFIVEKARSSG